MTMTKINLAEKKTVSEIKAGTVLKKNGDMFIVAKISEAQFSSTVDEALFGSRYDNSHKEPQQRRAYYPSPSSMITRRPTTEAVRNPKEPKYVLISLTTGMKFYPEFLRLQDLLIRVSRADFEIVNSIEIQEVL